MKYLSHYKLFESESPLYLECVSEVNNILTDFVEDNNMELMEFKNGFLNRTIQFFENNLIGYHIHDFPYAPNSRNFQFLSYDIRLVVYYVKGIDIDFKSLVTRIKSLGYLDSEVRIVINENKYFCEIPDYPFIVKHIGKSEKYYLSEYSLNISINAKM